MSFRQILIEGDPIHKNAPADAAITPGDLIILTATGVAVNLAASEGVDMQARVARELEYKSIDDDYAAADEVNYMVLRSGDVAYMWLEDGETASVDSPLGAGSVAGKLKVVDPATEAVMFRALEAVTASGSDERIQAQRQ